MKENLLKQWENLDFNDKYSIVQSINCYDNSLDHLQYYANEEDFFDTFYYNRPYELARAINYGEYNFMDDFVTINAYGNIESISKYEYEEDIEYYKEEIIDLIIEDIDTNNYNVLEYFNMEEGNDLK